MYLSKRDFKLFCKLVDMQPQGEDFILLPKWKQNLIVDCGVALMRMRKKQDKVNKKTYAYIFEKRKTNKNYGRTTYIKVKDRKENSCHANE